MATTGGGSGDDLLIGDNAIDLAIYTDATGDISVNLDDSIALDGGTGLDLLLSIERTGDASVGSDTLIGESGGIRFVHADAYGADTVGDFSGIADGQRDLVYPTGVTGINSFADDMSQWSHVGADVVIDFGGGDTLTLQNTFIASLQDDSIF